MYSSQDIQCSHWMGSPIRKSPDHRLLASSRGLSQLATSFIAFLRQGIHTHALSSLTIKSTSHTFERYYSVRFSSNKTCVLYARQIFSCQRSRSDHQFPVGTSPLQAERDFGLGPKARKNVVDNKKTRQRAPGGSVHFLRSSLDAPLERMCSKLDFNQPGIRNQPHLWMSRQARSVSRLSPESGLHQLPASIAKSKFPSSCIHDSFRSFFGPVCGFHRRLWETD